MLTLSNRLNRRSFMHIGGLSAGGLLAPGWLEAAGASPLTGKSVIFLFMHGGPSQIETFDPKMDAPSEIRSATGEIPTSLPGITYGATFEKLAKLAHKTAVVRSFVTGDGKHDIKPIVGKDSGGANIGSLFARVAGTSRPNGIPTNVGLFPKVVDADAQARNLNFGKFSSTGAVGQGFAPFIPGGGGRLQEDMKLQLDPNRLGDRRSLLAELDRLRREADRSGDPNLGGVDHLRQQAFDTLLGRVSDAFDLSREDPRTLARYDTAPLIDPMRISRKWNNHKNYRDHSQTLGKLLLMARRLCERGSGFVTVTTNFVWDMHADKNNATMTEGMDYVGKPFDHAVSAFIEDCEARGLGDKILLVCCGEMGRTPKINKNGGRDHWGNIAPLMCYGGGLRMGQVIGQSSRDGGTPDSTPVTIPNLVSTIMNVLFDTGQVRTMAELPREVVERITGSEPIRQLFG